MFKMFVILLTVVCTLHAGQETNPYDTKIAKIVWFGIGTIAGSVLIGTALYNHDGEMGSIGVIATGISIPFLVSGIKETIRYYRWEREHK